MLTVIKRDGSEVQFDFTKIIQAIKKAQADAIADNEIGFEIIDEKFFNRLKNTMLEEFSISENNLSVEEIQDVIVGELFKKPKYKNITNKYIKYRHERELARRGFTNLDARFKKIISSGDDENANKPSHLLNVKRDLIAGEYYRYRSEQNLPADLLEAHLNKTIHFHDTDFMGDSKTTNCCVFDLEDMLKNGTRVNNADIGEPNSIGVACTVATQIIANIAFQQYGGISVTNFNEIMARYAKKDFEREFKYICDILDVPYPEKISSDEKYEPSSILAVILKRTKDKTSKLIENACQTVEYQVSSISSSSQTPFAALAFNIPTSWESEQIILKYFKIRREGLGYKNKKIAIFPKLSLFVVDGYNLKEGDPYFNITVDASKTIAKCFYPDILHIKREDYDKGRYFARMGKHI